MRKSYILTAVALIMATFAAAQNPTAYFMEGATFRSQYNPAFAPLRGYFNIPGLGHMNINSSGNVALDNFLFPRGDKLVTMLDSSVSAAAALGNLKDNNTLGSDTRINLLGFGAYTRNGKNFWSFDVNMRINSDFNMPYELFDFLKTGKDGRISNIGLAANGYMEAGFNYSFPLLGNLLNDKLYIGVRGKFLVGLARAQLNYDHFDVSLKEDMWRIAASGYLDMTAGGAATKDITLDKNGNYTIDDLDPSVNKPAGYGFAVDLGATYDILPNLQASLAVNDLGFISWDKSMSSRGRSVKQMEFTGVIIDENGVNEQPDFDLDVLEFTPSKSAGGSKSLRASLNAGIEYEVWKHKVGVGLLYTAHFWEYSTMHNITGSVNFHPVRWFCLSGSYSFLNNRGHAVGLAMNLCPNWINFFIGTDLLTAKRTPQWVPISQSTMNITVGLGIPIGKRGQRIEAYN